MISSKSFPLRERLNFLIYIISRVVLNLGYTIYLFSVSYIILSVTDSALLFSINMIIGSVVSLIALPFSGVVSDRYNKRKIILSGEIFLSFTIATLFIVTLIYDFNLISIYITTFIASIINPFVSNAYQASLTDIFHSDRVQQIMGYTGALLSSASLVGPLLAGVLYGFFDFSTIILIFSLIYIFSTLLDFFIDFTLYKDNLAKDSSHYYKDNLKSDFFVGINYLKEKKFLVNIFCMAAFINFFAAIFYIFPEKFMIVELSFSPIMVGIVNSIASIGMLIGGLVIGSLKQFKNPIKLQKYSLYIWACLLLVYLLPAYGSIGNDYVLTFSFGVVGFCVALMLQLINVPLFTYLQMTIPQNIKGRVFSILNLLSNSVAPIGMIIFAFLYDHITMWIVNLVAFLCVLFIVTYFLNTKVITTSKQEMNKVNYEMPNLQYREG